MHLVVTVPGVWFVTLYIAAPASLSLIETVPAENEFPGLVVVAENAENTAEAMIDPARPTTTSVASTFFDVFTGPPLCWWMRVVRPADAVLGPTGRTRHADVGPCDLMHNFGAKRLQRSCGAAAVGAPPGRREGRRRGGPAELVRGRECQDGDGPRRHLGETCVHHFGGEPGAP